MPHSENNIESSDFDPLPDRNDEQTANGMAGNRPSRGYDACTQNDDVRSENRSIYLSDHMSPNNDTGQQRTTNGANTESIESGRQSS